MNYFADVTSNGELTGGHHYMDGGWGFGMFGMLFMLAIAVLIIMILVKYSEDRAKGNSRSEDALEIAKKRYAKGDITQKEYTELKKDLK